MMLMQLLGKEDDEVVEDPEYLTGRWQAYVDGFVSVGININSVFLRVGALIVSFSWQSETTPSVDTSRMRRPFLRKCVVAFLRYRPPFSF